MAPMPPSFAYVLYTALYEGQSKINRTLCYSARLCLSSMEFSMQAGTCVPSDHDQLIYLLDRLLHVF